jgi:hypothetical protein
MERPPRGDTSEAVARLEVRAASEDELRLIITNGKGHMPKFGGKLTTDKISALVQQIKALNQK